LVYSTGKLITFISTLKNYERKHIANWKDVAVFQGEKNLVLNDYYLEIKKESSYIYRERRAVENVALWKLYYGDLPLKQGSGNIVWNFESQPP